MYSAPALPKPPEEAPSEWLASAGEASPTTVSAAVADPATTVRKIGRMYALSRSGSCFPAVVPTWSDDHRPGARGGGPGSTVGM